MTDSRLIIQGGRKISGEITLQGAKNACLPILAATLLFKGKCAIHNCPVLSDIYTTSRILTSLGGSCRRECDTLLIDTQTADGYEISEDLMRKMRSSIVFMGALLARNHRCRLSFPGGCELGARPIDIHLWALRKLGVEVSESHGSLDCTLSGEINSCRLVLPFPSVGATENIMLLAAKSSATVTIINAAREPEIVDLAGFINACGGNIQGAGTQTVTIIGKAELTPHDYRVMPDRIVGGTYLAAAAITGGELLLRSANREDMDSILSCFEQMGASIYSYSDKIYLSAKNPLKPIKSLKTQPYPGFPTDIQPIMMSLLTKAKGTSLIYESIFENRFRAAGELCKMGAHIKTEGRLAVIEGGSPLWGATVYSCDLRAGAALVLAGLSAEGETVVKDIHYIDRGYEAIERNLCSLGASVKRV